MLLVHELQQGAEAACCTATVPAEGSRLVACLQTALLVHQLGLIFKGTLHTHLMLALLIS